MKVNICASLVSLPAFVVANVRDNVRHDSIVGTITTQNSLPHYSLSFYQQIRLICRIYLLTIVISND